MTQWISVKDELPQEHLKVLLFIPTTSLGFSTVILGNLRITPDNTKMWQSLETSTVYINMPSNWLMPLKVVSHWMPLPEPPSD